MQLIGDGALSMVIPVQVIEAAEETVARMDGEAAQGPVKVTGCDLQQWNKVVCCVTVLKMCIRQVLVPGLHEMTCGDDSVSETTA